MNTEDNPLLSMSGLPPFSRLRPEHVVPAIEHIIADNLKQVDTMLAANSHYTWENLVQPLEDMDERLDRVWSPVSHMNSVVNTEALRETHNDCLPKLSHYGTAMGQNVTLFNAYRSIADSDEYQKMDIAQKKIIDNALRDFHLSGVDLPEDKKARFKTIQEELSNLTSKYENNLLDATNTWQKIITDEAVLSGLPESARALAKQTAEQKEIDGWVFNLEFPSYIAVMTYADDQTLRKEVYTAYATRASDQGPHAKQWDNSPLMEDILRLRQESAQLLGFDNYPQRSLATKMAATTTQVLDFLNDLAVRSLPIAKKDYNELETFARDECNATMLDTWDIAYYSEKLRQKKYNITQEELKPYFPDDHVIGGMFKVVGRLYGITIKAVEGIDTWHDDVRFYEIRDNKNELCGQFYLDLYARPHKRGGAWMDECISRQRRGQELQTPVAYLTCNFSPPIGDDPALLTHDEVVTLFHEFGHGLHHMLTKIDYPAVAGTSGVAWDAVELPSQFMENWCWQREALDLISGHYQTGKPLPQDMYEKLLAARNFQAGMQMVRQLEFALFDFRLHMEYDPDDKFDIYGLLDEIRDQVAVIKPPSFNRFAHGFSHIFAGGYAAGYYSYKWAEVLSADAFSKFEEKGIFDSETGKHFLQTILEQGGSREPMELFVEFRGREPTIDALLRHNGLVA